MRHRIRGRQLSRDTEHRISLRRSLAQSLFEHGRIKTTLPKAKEVQGLVEKLITLARRAHNAPADEKGKLVKLNARRRVVQLINDRRLVDKNQDFITEGSKTVVQRLFNDIAPKITSPGGYTRIVKLAKWRIGDAGDIVQLELVSETPSPKGTARKSQGLRRKRAERKKAFATKIRKAKAEAPAA